MQCLVPRDFPFEHTRMLVFKTFTSIPRYGRVSILPSQAIRIRSTLIFGVTTESASAMACPLLTIDAEGSVTLLARSALQR